MGKIKLILGASILLIVSGQVNAELIVNGGFEEPVVDRPLYNYEHRNGFELTGWESFSSYTPAQGDDPGSVHFNSRYSAVSEGNQAVQLEVPGDWIRQSFATTIGQWYVLSFDLSAYNITGGFLEVDVGNVSQQFNGPENEYIAYSLDFMALAETTTLTFTSISTFGTYPHIDNVSIVPTATLVTIDIKPDSDPNCFNINDHGVIPVAILGSDSFDVTEIVQDSLSFGGMEVRMRGNKGPLCQVDYSDGDEYLDLVCQFEDNSDYWSPGDGEATLTGSLINEGGDFEGTDSICVVP